MKGKLGIAGLGFVLLLGGALASPTKTYSQDVSSESAKRKVKTRVTPDYPTLAKQMRVTGKVKIETTIAADGHVSSTKVVGGSPLLVNAAQDAVGRWKWTPAPQESKELIELSFHP